jgi:hydroxyacylglutathione hydrolase
MRIFPLYDYRTGILLTGDSLYPGRLYVAAPDFPAFAASAQRLVDFTRHHPVTHILGTHIEQTRTPYVDYPRGTRYQPDEHVLELSPSDLLALNQALQRLHGKPEKVALPTMTVVVRFPGARREGNAKQ